MRLKRLSNELAHRLRPDLSELPAMLQFACGKPRGTAKRLPTVIWRTVGERSRQYGNYENRCLVVGVPVDFGCNQN